MTDFENFIAKNKLKKKDIAAYLGVSPAFITQLVSGLRQVPDDKLALIKASSQWDVSMFGKPVLSKEPTQLELDFSKVADACQKAANAAEESATTGRILAESNSKLIDNNGLLLHDNSKVLNLLVASIARLEDKIDKKGVAEDVKGAAQRAAHG